MIKAYIKAISYYLPEKILSNEELSKEFPEWTVEKIANKIGIGKRHIAATDETATDMAISAASKLFSEHAIHPADIDFVLLCTQSPDYFLPTSACIVQNKLNIPVSAGALDFNLGCSGFVYGLSLAQGLILAQTAKNILLITSETYSKHMHPKDKGNRTIFGDAATATLISTDGYAEIQKFSLGSDGAGYDNLIVKTGGMRQKDKLQQGETDSDGNFTSPDYLFMNGAEIFNFTLDSVPKLVTKTLENNDTQFEQIDLFVFHQANKYMMNFLRKKITIPEDKFYYCLENFGNTVSSTIPIALKEAMAENKINKSQKVLIAGFGVGYSWGGTILQF